MAKKSTSSLSSPAASPVSSTAVRNTAVPPRASSPLSTSSRKQPSRDEIARRAYEIWKSGKGGSPEENWFRAERELRSAY